MDPWKHRSKGMKCATCMWFAPKEEEPGNPATIGRCRRHAPTMGGYPVVYLDDWCGDHKLDGEKARQEDLRERLEYEEMLRMKAEAEQFAEHLQPKQA